MAPTVTPDGATLLSSRKRPPSNVTVLRKINLTVRDGEFMVLVGPSGCGKSTLLRLIAGLEAITGGTIWVGDRPVNHLPPKARNIAMVFQSYALYPHLTVYDNLAFGLRRTYHYNRKSVASPTQRLQRGATDWLAGFTRSLPGPLRYRTAAERTIEQRIKTVAQMLQIEELLNRLPRELSGGQKQRVALGRAMARNPEVFLMDEPLSNLDAKLRAETRAQIVNLQRQLGTTTVYVTHDQVEAMTMGDRIAVMRSGQIQQIATPMELYNTPANRFVAEFIGSPPMNFLRVQVKAPLMIIHPYFRLTLPEIWARILQVYNGQSLILGIRPEHLKVSEAAPQNLPVQVQRIEAFGHETHITAAFPEPERGQQETLTLQARIAPDYPVQVGESLWLSPVPERIHLFDEATHNALLPDT